MNNEKNKTFADSFLEECQSLSISEIDVEHHGIRGMKWGVRRTPAQLGHKKGSSVTDLKSKIEKIHSNRQKEKVKKLKEKAKLIKAKNEVKSAKNAVKEAKKKQEEKEELAKQKAQQKQEAKDKAKAISEAKEKMLQRLDANEIYANKHLFNDNELKSVINRLNTEKQLKSITDSQVATGKSAVQSIGDKMMSAEKYILSGAKIANAMISVVDNYNKATSTLYGAKTAKRTFEKGETKTDDKKGNSNNKSDSNSKNENKQSGKESKKDNNDSSKKSKSDNDKKQKPNDNKDYWSTYFNTK